MFLNYGYTKQICSDYAGLCKMLESIGWINCRIFAKPPQERKDKDNFKIQKFKDKIINVSLWCVIN